MVEGHHLTRPHPFYSDQLRTLHDLPISSSFFELAAANAEVELRIRLLSFNQLPPRLCSMYEIRDHPLRCADGGRQLTVEAQGVGSHLPCLRNMYLLLDLGLYTSYTCIYIPVSYTHLTLPTTPYV